VPEVVPRAQGRGRGHQALLPSWQPTSVWCVVCGGRGASRCAVGRTLPARHAGVLDLARSDDGPVEALSPDGGAVA
jgi:hypothetical protein